MRGRRGRLAYKCPKRRLSAYTAAIGARLADKPVYTHLSTYIGRVFVRALLRLEDKGPLGPLIQLYSFIPSREGLIHGRRMIVV
jgi:hypothetical protein